MAKKKPVVAPVVDAEAEKPSAEIDAQKDPKAEAQVDSGSSSLDSDFRKHPKFDKFSTLGESHK